jgi:hypothetical protein
VSPSADSSSDQSSIARNRTAGMGANQPVTAQRGKEGQGKTKTEEGKERREMARREEWKGKIYARKEKATKLCCNR